MSVNKVILVGNLGKDPELKYTPAGAAVVSFSMATTETYKDKDGNRQSKTEWHNIVAWRQLAEICGKFLHKGKQVYVEGKLTTRKWQDRDGNDRYTTEIVIHDMKMLGKTSDNNGGGQNQNNNQGGNQQHQGGNQQHQGGNQQHQGSNQQHQGSNQQHQGGGQNQNQSYAAQAGDQQRPAPVYEEPAFNPDEIPF